MPFKFEVSADKVKIGDLEISKEFIETYKTLLLQAAKKFFGEHIQFNPDEKIVNSIIIGELRNMIMYGHAYCPCRIQRIREHICPCEPAKEELKKDGICTCKLFIDPNIYRG